MTLEGIYIIVCDRGFVFAADIVVSRDVPFTYHAKRCCTIRRWGTTKGLAELQNGPLPNTILDPPCEAQIPFRAELYKIIPTEKGRKAWSAVLSK